MIQIDLLDEENPLLVEMDITNFVSDGLRNRSLPLYSAYLLELEAVRIGRLGYLQPAWGRSLSIFGVLTMFSEGSYGK